MTAFKYSFDKEGNSPSNLITAESHIITSSTALPILFTEGLVYVNDSLVITNAGTGDTLTVGTDNDFTWVGSDADITALTGIQTACGILLTDTTFTGTLNFTYQCVGGPEGRYSSILDDLIAAIELANENDSISWEDITGKPSLFPPEVHTHALSQLTELNTLTEALWSLSQSITNQIPLGTSSQNIFEKLDGLFNVQAQMQNFINQAQLVDNVNPNITYLVNRIDAMYGYADATTSVTDGTSVTVLTGTGYADGDHHTALGVISTYDTDDTVQGSFVVMVTWSESISPRVIVIGGDYTLTGSPTFEATLSGTDLLLSMTPTATGTAVGKWLAIL